MDILQKISDMALFNIVNNIYKHTEHAKVNKICDYLMANIEFELENCAVLTEFNQIYFTYLD